MIERRITEEEWAREFLPQDAPDGGRIWEYEDIPKDTPDTHVWTWIEGEDGSEVVVNGYHLVNKLGYAITENPWPVGGFIEATAEGTSDKDRAIEEIALILWWDHEEKRWDRDKEWDSDTLTQVANVLTDRGFGPDPEAGWFESAIGEDS